MNGHTQTSKKTHKKTKHKTEEKKNIRKLFRLYSYISSLNETFRMVSTGSGRRTGE